MRTLKHWTISVQPVRKGRDGYLAYYQYLTNNSGKHKNNVINEFSSKKNAFLTIRNGDAFNLANQLKKNGGRPSNYGYSAMFSYVWELDPKIIKRIYVFNMRKFFRFVSDFNNLNFSSEDIDALIQKETVAIMHSGAKPNGEAIHNHLHVIIPKHFKHPTKAGLVSVNLTHKRYLKALLGFNNETINEVLGYRVFEYEIQSREKQKKRKSSTEYEIEKRIVAKVDETHELLDEIQEQIRAYHEWAQENDEYDEAIPKELNRALTQVKNGNTERARKSLEKFKKNMMDR